MEEFLGEERVGDEGISCCCLFSFLPPEFSNCCEFVILFPS